MISYKSFLRLIGVSACGIFMSTKIYASEATDHFMGFTTQNAEVNGINQVYIDQGQGPVMVFLHGYPFFSGGWQPLLERFESTHRVIAPDNRGFGNTDKPDTVNEYHLSRLTADVKSLIELVSPDKSVVLIGHDWGGTLAWAVAQAHPDAVEKVIVINAPPHNVLLDRLLNDIEQQKASHYFEILKSNQVEEAFVAKGPDMLWQYGFHNMLSNGYITEDYKQAFFNAWSQPQAIRGAMNWYRANLPSINDISDELYWPSKNARVTIPSLLITSEFERVFTRGTFEAIADIADDFTFEVIPKAGHTPYFEQPDKVELLIRQFIQN